MQASCSPAEWSARVDLAACYRLCHNAGLNEGIDNHLTALVPDTSPPAFLCIAYGQMWSEVTASSLLTLTADGEVLRGEGEPDGTAFFIHKHIHVNDPVNAVCVLHTHQRWASALCCLDVEDPLPMIHQNCLRFYKSFSWDTDFDGLVLDDAKGDKVNQLLQGKRVLFHANHGVIVSHKSIAQAFDDLYYLEVAARVVCTAFSLNRPLLTVKDEVAQQFLDDYNSMGHEWAQKHFDAAKRCLNTNGRDSNYDS